MRQLAVEEAKAMGIPVPYGAIGVTIHSWESVFPENLPVIRWGERAPQDIKKGERVMLVFGEPTWGMAKLVEAVLGAEAALEEGEHCTCWQHVEGLRVALRGLVDAADVVLKRGKP